uniref:Regulatory protein zeste n=1 Tax=Meloidogyne hapla TaxID=6305 RepID=A0A1I8C2Q4_MELHA
MNKLLTPKAEERNRARIIFLKAILERKDVIFGGFSPNLTNKDKENAWNEVKEETLSNGIDKYSTKSWTKLRDECWQDLRKATLGKRDKKRLTGGEAGDDYNEVDNLVLAIVGQASVEGLGVAESGEEEKNNKIKNNSSPSTSKILHFSSPKRVRPLKRNFPKQASPNDELTVLKRKLLEKQVENEELRGREISANFDC